jgi:hypothetical protein
MLRTEADVAHDGDASVHDRPDYRRSSDHIHEASARYRPNGKEYSFEAANAFKPRTRLGALTTTLDLHTVRTSFLSQPRYG